MKAKPVLTRGVPNALVTAFNSDQFACAVLGKIVGQCLGVSDVFNRPAEFYMQEPDYAVSGGGPMAVIMTLTGVSRDGRTAKQFHDALKALHEMTVDKVQTALDSEHPGYARVQVFTYIMLDGQVETAPGSGKYSNLLESEAVWVETRKPAETLVAAGAR